MAYTERLSEDLGGMMKPWTWDGPKTSSTRGRFTAGQVHPLTTASRLAGTALTHGCRSVCTYVRVTVVRWSWFAGGRGLVAGRRRQVSDDTQCTRELARAIVGRGAPPGTQINILAWVFCMS